MKPTKTTANNEEISLCHSCNCVTKTIKNRCGKCGDSKMPEYYKPPTPDKAEWEEKFEDYYTEHWIEDNGEPSVRYIGEDGVNIIDFIQSQISQTRAEVLNQIGAEISKMREANPGLAGLSAAWKKVKREAMK